MLSGINLGMTLNKPRMSIRFLLLVALFSLYPGGRSNAQQYRRMCMLSTNLEYGKDIDSNIVNGFYKKEYQINFSDSNHVKQLVNVMTKSLQRLVDSLVKIAGSDLKVTIMCAAVANAETGWQDDTKLIKVNLNTIFDWLTKDKGGTLSSFGLLAHEVSHWILKHRPMDEITSQQSKRNELEADRLAGMLVGKAFYAKFTYMIFGSGLANSIEDLKKSGDANLPNIERYIGLLPKTGTATHPPREQRVTAFEKGYYEGIKSKLLSF
jgi:hypothetical protein